MPRKIWTTFYYKCLPCYKGLCVFANTISFYNMRMQNRRRWLLKQTSDWGLNKMKNVQKSGIIITIKLCGNLGRLHRLRRHKFVVVVFLEKQDEYLSNNFLSEKVFSFGTFTIMEKIPNVNIILFYISSVYLNRHI